MAGWRACQRASRLLLKVERFSFGQPPWGGHHQLVETSFSSHPQMRGREPSYCEFVSLPLAPCEAGCLCTTMSVFLGVRVCVGSSRINSLPCAPLPASSVLYAMVPNLSQAVDCIVSLAYRAQERPSAVSRGSA